jgi:DNA-binding XRE family transcriptional regulator
MTESRKLDGEAKKRDAARLNVAHLDEKAELSDIHGPDAQAVFLGVSRAHLYKLRAGECGASVTLGLRMARKLRTTVERLFVEVSA